MQTGFGRTGEKFMFQHYGFKPDLICVGKAMGGGYPLMALPAQSVAGYDNSAPGADSPWPRSRKPLASRWDF